MDMDDKIPKDKVVVHSSENLQLSINGKHHDSWTKYEYDRTREEDAEIHLILDESFLVAIYMWM